jgi:CHASE2 domain-containing sensor protein
MRRLWDEEVKAGSHRLRLETLKRLGGADTIVHGHLEDAMGKLPRDQRDAAAAAFRFLVKSTGRKIALSTDELREFSDADGAALEPALEHLKRERILRPLPSAEPDGVTRHEIYHDVLAPAIREWRRAETERRLEAARRRARRLEVRNRRLAAAVVALTALAVALALYLWDPKPVQRLELGTVDTRFTVRGTRAPDPRLALIAVDDRTLRRFGASRSGLLPRVQYAHMLDRLRRDRPAVIALDVRFESARAGDRALLAAIRATRERLVLAYKAFVAGSDTSGREVLYPDLFGDANTVEDIGVRTGYAGFPQDVDKRHRRADYTIDLVRENRNEGTSADSATAETLAFAAADIVRRGALDRRIDDLPTASRRAWGGQSERTTWTDYAGPPGTIRPISALDLLDGEVRPGAFRDKLVVIGVFSPSNPDHLASPLDHGREMPGAEMQANAIDTLIRDEPLRDTSSLINILAIVLLACVPAAAGLIRSIPIRTAAIVAVAIFFLAAAQLAFDGGRVVAVVTPLTALLVAAGGVAGMTVARAVRRRRAAVGPGADRSRR